MQFAEGGRTGRPATSQLHRLLVHAVTAVAAGAVQRPFFATDGLPVHGEEAYLATVAWVEAQEAVDGGAARPPEANRRQGAHLRTTSLAVSRADPILAAAAADDPLVPVAGGLLTRAPRATQAVVPGDGRDGTKSGVDERCDRMWVKAKRETSRVAARWDAGQRGSQVISRLLA